MLPLFLFSFYRIPVQNKNTTEVTLDCSFNINSKVAVNALLLKPRETVL